eukprot:1909731-Rhodomonas_salina.1
MLRQTMLSAVRVWAQSADGEVVACAFVGTASPVDAAHNALDSNDLAQNDTEDQVGLFKSGAPEMFSFLLSTGADPEMVAPGCAESRSGSAVYARQGLASSFDAPPRSLACGKARCLRELTLRHEEFAAPAGGRQGREGVSACCWHELRVRNKFTR